MGVVFTASALFPMKGSASFSVTVNDEASYDSVTVSANLSANANGSTIYTYGALNNHSWDVLSPSNPLFLTNTFRPGFIANEQTHAFLFPVL